MQSGLAFRMISNAPPPEDSSTQLDEPEAAISRRPVHDILEDLRAAVTSDEVSVGALLRAMDSSGKAVVLLLPALVVVTPLSGIPGLSSLGGLTIALISFQMLLRRPTVWLPQFVMRRRIPAARLHTALNGLRRPAGVIDRCAAPRLRWLFNFPGRQILQATCMACGLAMPFLELVPLSATTLATAVVIMAVSLIVRDGLFALLGLGSVAGAVWLIAWLMGA